MMMKIWRHANPTRITFHLFVFVCEGAHVRAHQRYEVSPPVCACVSYACCCLVWPSLGCLRAQNNEPVSRSLAKNLFIHPGWSSVERGDASRTGGRARVRRGTSSRLSRQHPPRLFPERRSISPHAPHTQLIYISAWKQLDMQMRLKFVAVE